MDKKVSQYCVTCNDGQEFFYNEKEWSQLCLRVKYFDTFRDFVTNARFEECWKRNIVALKGIDSDVYRWVDVYGRMGTFGDSIMPQVFGKILEAADYFQIDGADEDLARVVDETFFQSARELLDRFTPSHFTQTKSALTDLWLHRRVLCNDGRAFFYNEPEWLKLCERVNYFDTFQDFVTETATRCNEGSRGKTVTLKGIDSDLYRWVDAYAGTGTFGDTVAPDVFGEILEAADYFQIDGADECLASAVDETFFESDKFLESVWDLFQRFLPSQFTHLKSSLAHVCLYLEDRADLHRRVPKGLVRYLFSCDRRRFGLERDVFRVALACYESQGTFSDLLSLIRDFRIDWPPRVSPWIFSDNTKAKIDQMNQRLADEWMADDVNSRSFVKSENALLCRRILDVDLEHDYSPDTDENFYAVFQSLSVLVHRGFINDEFLRRKLYQDESKVLRRPRYSYSTLVMTKGCSLPCLYEYHPYLQRFRLLALPDVLMEGSDYVLVPQRSTGIWMIFKEDSCIGSTWFIDFNQDFKRSFNFTGSPYLEPYFQSSFKYSEPDTFEHYQWREMHDCSLPVCTTDLFDGVTLYVSSGHVDDSPLIFIGNNDQEYRGHFLEHGRIGGFVTIEATAAKMRAVSHHSVDETRTKIYVLLDSNQLAIYTVDKIDTYGMRDMPIFEQEITFEKMVNLSSINSMLYTWFRPLGCTPCGLPFFIGEHSVTYKPNKKMWDISLDCAILKEDDVLDRFVLRFSDRKRPPPSCDDGYRIEVMDVDVSTTDQNVIIREGRLALLDWLKGRQIIIDVVHRKARIDEYPLKVEQNDPFSNNSSAWSLAAWKEHRPFVTSELPSCRLLTDRALIPSSRGGFWRDLERDRRDNSDPYDVVDWETVNFDTKRSLDF